MFAAWLPAQAITIGTYADTRHGVSIEYPSAYALTQPIPFNLGDPLISPEHPATAAFTQQTGHEGTFFAGAELIYSTRGTTTPAACAALAGSVHAGRVVIGGVRYTHAATSEGGMGHARADQLYTTYRHGTCYLFDLALLTVSAYPNTRPLTAKEKAGILSGLRSILENVQFQPVPARH